MTLFKGLQSQHDTSWNPFCFDLGDTILKFLSSLKCDFSIPTPPRGCDWSPPTSCHVTKPDCGCPTTPPENPPTTTELVVTCIGKQGDTYEALDWVTGTGVVLYARHYDALGPGNVPLYTTTVLGDGVNDATDAAVFDPDLPASEFPFAPAVWNNAKGIGVDNLNSIYSFRGESDNGEINAGFNDNRPSDVLGVDLNKQVVAAKIGLSLFYYTDATSQPDSNPVVLASATCETAIVRIGNDLDSNGILEGAEILGTARIRADGVVLSATSTAGTMLIAGHAIAPDLTDIAVGGGNDYKMDRTNGGLFDMDVALTDANGVAIKFDFVEVLSGGLQGSLSQTDVNAIDPSDFLLRSLCYTEEVITNTPPQEPVPCYEGLSHGYWKNHTSQWDGKGTDCVDAFDVKDSFEQTFGVDVKGVGSTWTLLDALKAKGGGEMALAREAVGALLNASCDDINYLYTAQQVIDLVKDAYTAGGAYAKGSFEAVKDVLETQNTLELCCDRDLVPC